MRPGAALFGVNPTPGKPNPMKPVVELKVRIATLRDIAFGETVGYDATWTARRPSRIAIVTMGYADGFFRSQSGSDQKPGGTLIVDGKPCPIVGRISMDLIALDVTDLPAGSVKRGDFATVIGEGTRCRCARRDARHHRLRGADQSRAALCAHLQERLNRFAWTPCGMQPLDSRHESQDPLLRLPELRRRLSGAGRASASPAASGIRSPRNPPTRPLGKARRAKPPGRGRAFALQPLSGASDDAPRLATGLSEFDRVTGGGLVRGSVLLVGGDPGIGKSTLLVQVAAAMARLKHRSVYISGEEAVAQVRLRAERLALADAAVELASETSVEDIIATLSQGELPRLVVIDSIQTMWTNSVESAPGTVTQVRASAQALIRFAKRTRRLRDPGRPCHQGRPDRRAPRGRTHGRCGDVVRGRRLASIPHSARGEKPLRPDRRDRRVRDDGLGLREVQNPSELFLSERDLGSPGTAVFAGIEGTRPVLVEIQALVAPTSLGTPRRAVVGWDPSRLSMVIAVLEAHCGVRLATHDVYLNVAGGLRINEPAADLAAAAALVSSLAGAPLPADAVYFGEVSLSGAMRPVAQAPARLKEAAKLGFQRAFLPDPGRADAPADAGLALTHARQSGIAGRRYRRARQPQPSETGSVTQKAAVAYGFCASMRLYIRPIGFHCLFANCNRRRHAWSAPASAVPDFRLR